MENDVFVGKFLGTKHSLRARILTHPTSRLQAPAIRPPLRTLPAACWRQAHDQALYQLAGSGR